MASLCSTLCDRCKTTTNGGRAFIRRHPIVVAVTAMTG